MGLENSHHFLDRIWPLCAGESGFSTQVGSEGLAVQCPDSSWVTPLSRGFWSSSPEIEENTSFQIRVMGRSDLQRLPPFPLTLARESARGRIEDWCSEDFLAVGFPWGLCLADRPAGRALLYYDTVDSIPVWDVCAPLRTALGFLAPARDLHLLHGAAVSYQGAGCLLVGKGGSGKSSSALSALSAGSSLNFISEDYTLIELETLTVHPLYRSFKIGREGLARMPFLQSFETLGDQDGKTCSLVDKRLAPDAARLKSVLWPDLEQTLPLGSIPRGQALLKLAPSTLFQNPNASRSDFQALAELCRGLDSYRLGLAHRPSAKAVEETLRGLLMEGVRA